jgi:DNA-binding transcriptional LysR family regulator
MDLRRIKQFVVLSETLNFHRAAERLHIAQPALSVSIKKLEEELGVQLFLRDPSGVTLTVSGKMVLQEAHKLLFHGEQLAEAASNAMDGTGGRLEIGFVGSAIHGLLQRLLPQFRTAYPGVELVLREGTSISIVQQLEDRSLDVGLIRVPLITPTKANIAVLEKDVYMAALPRGHALAAKGPLALSELANESFIIYSAQHPTSSAAGLHSAMMIACQTAGFTPRVAQQAVQIQTVLALVESGLGVALVPSIMKRYVSDRIVYRQLIDTPEQASVGLALASVPDSESPAAVNFRKLSLQVFASSY